MTNLILTAPLLKNVIVLSWWQIILILIVLAICITFILNFIFRFRGRNDIDLFGIKIRERKNKNSPNNSQSLNQSKNCATCENVVNMGPVITLLSDYTIKIHNLRYRQLLSEQMQKAEEYILRIKDASLSAVSENINKSLLEKSIVNIKAVHHTDYLMFKLSLNEFMARFKDMIRTACLNNGFSELETMEYKEYVNKQLTNLGNMAQRFFSENLITTVINPKEIFNNALLAEMSKLVVMLFSNLKDIGLNMYKEIERLEIQKKELMAKQWGLSQ